MKNVNAICIKKEKNAEFKIYQTQKYRATKESW